MSKYFGFVDGKAHDFEFKNHHYPNWKLFYLGEHLIATLIKLKHKAGWGVIVHQVEDNTQTPANVEGFVSRHAAIDYALMVHVKTRDIYNRDRALVIGEKKYLSEKEKADV